MLPIYVDLDDVLSDTTQTFVEILRREFGKMVAFEDILSFDLKISFGFTQGEYEQFFQMVHQPEVIMNFAPIAGAIEVLSEWSKLGYKISIVTGRLTIAHQASLDWLAKHKVPHHFFVMVDKYSRENTDKNIALSLEDFSKLKFSLAVEDSAAMAQHLSRQMRIPVALLNRPWNRTAAMGDNVKRYDSWYDILDDFPAP
jgi:uncharacterized HAD superfamily protein